MGPTRAEQPQDWRVLLGLCCFGSLFDITAWGHLQAFTPLFLKQELQMSAADIPFWTGVLAATPLVLAVPLAPLWGVLADRYSRKLLILRSLVLEGIGYGVAAFSHSLALFLLVRLLLGLAFGNVALMVASLSLATPERRLGTAVGIFTTMSPLGLSVGPLLGSALISLAGLRGMFAADAALCLLAALVLGVWVREPRGDPRRPLSGIWREIGAVFVIVQRVPAIRWNFVLWFLVGGGAAALDPYLPVLIGRVASGPALATTIGLVLGVYGVATGVCTPLAPRLAGRIGEVRALALASLALGLIALALPLSASVLVIGALALLRAAPQATTNTALYTHLARHAPRERRAAVMTLSPLPRNVAMLLVPLAGSALSPLGLGAVFALGGVLFLLGFGVTLVLERAEAPRRLAEPVSKASPG